MKQALETADTNKLISDLDAALADTETSFSYAGSSRTMKGLLDGWFAAMDDVADEAALESFMSAAEPQLDDIADVYVAALEAADEAAVDAALKAAYDNVNGQSVKTETVTTKSLDALREAVKEAIKAKAGNDDVIVNTSNYASNFPSDVEGGKFGELELTGYSLTLTMEGSDDIYYPSITSITLVYDFT